VILNQSKVADDNFTRRMGYEHCSYGLVVQLLTWILQSTPSKASSTFIAKSKLKKKKSVHFQESKDPGSGDESELSCQSSSSCPACGRRKSILKKGGKEKVKRLSRF